VPDADKLPLASAIKLVFSVHAVPFQYNVLLIVLPSATAPVMVAQNVDVPFDARY
jgi:hypothetical protein